MITDSIKEFENVKNLFVDDFMNLGHDQLLILHSDKNNEDLGKFTLFVHSSKIIKNGELIEGKFNYFEIYCIRKRRFKKCSSLFRFESITF